MIIEHEASLKNCPLCASLPVLRGDGWYSRTTGINEAPARFWVKCTEKSCGISPASQPSMAMAIEIWNRRAS